MQYIICLPNFKLREYKKGVYGLVVGARGGGQCKIKLPKAFAGQEEAVASSFRAPYTAL